MSSQGLDYPAAAQTFHATTSFADASYVKPSSARGRVQACLGKGNSGWVCVPSTGGNARSQPVWEALSPQAKKSSPSAGSWSEILPISSLEKSGMTMEYGRPGNKTPGVEWL